MSTGHLLIEDGAGPRREALRAGLTRVGGRGADVRLDAAGEAQLQVQADGPAGARLVLVGGGPRPRVDGVEVVEAALTAGTRIEWGGATITFLGAEGGTAPATLPADAARDEVDASEMEGWGEVPAAPDPAASTAAPAPVAALEPVPAAVEPAPPPAPPVAAPASTGFDDAEAERAWRRLHAGLLVELGLADKKVAKAWQARVRDGGFDPDLCARELLTSEKTKPDPGRVLDRATRLQRDLLMSPLLRGARGAGRAARTATKGFFAMLIAQAFAIGVYSLILLAIALVFRAQGKDLHGFLDAILSPLNLDP